MKNILKSILKWLPLFLYGIWAAVGILVACAGKVLLGLAFLWIPLLALFFVWLLLALAWVAGDHIKASSPETCQNCVFQKQKEISGQCAGEVCGEVYGKRCPYYARFDYDRPGTQVQ